MFDDNAPLVSVIIPTYGRAELLSRAIDSVLEQTYQNLEIIVINDNHLNSEHYQPTVMIMKKYENNPKVKFVSDGRNVGGSLARNKGIDASLGEYISFLDDDDYYYSNKLAEQISLLLSSNADVCLCNMDILKNNNISKDKRSYAKASSIQEFLIEGNCFTPMIFCKKNILIEINGFEKSPRFQDHILLLKILKANYKISILDKSLFVHNDHDGDRITKNKIGSYDVRWFFEDQILDKLDSNSLKCYWFNRNMNQVRIYRDNSLRSKALNLIILNLKNISRKNDILIFFKVFLSLIIKF